MVRTPRHARAINTGRVNVIGRAAGVPDQRGRRPYTVSDAHKQKMLDALTDEPAGLKLEELSRAIGLGVDRTRSLLDEMYEQGLVGRLGGRGQAGLWVAEV